MYITKTGGANHFKIKGEILSFYEFYNLDIIVFAIFVIRVCAIYQLLRYLVSSICASKSKIKSD